MKNQKKELNKRQESAACRNFGSSESRTKAFALALFLAALLASAQAGSFSASGSGKTFEFDITSGKNANASSSNFKAYSVIGDIIGAANSSSFKTELGFLRTLPYLDGESCKADSECVGGFCCSNSCRSSACPTESAPVSTAAGAAAASGGEGGAEETPKIEDFEIGKEIIKALIKQGGAYKTRFSVKNTGTAELSFGIDYSALQNFMLLSDTRFSLAPNESKSVDVALFAGEEQKPDVYSGNIMVKGGGITKSLPVIIEVQAKKALFDITVKVLPQRKNVLKTENAAANITLINVGDLKPVDAQLYYSVRGIDGNELAHGFETLAVYNKISAIKEIELPPNITLGAYVFYAKVSYGIEAAAAGDIFNVVSSKPDSCFDGIKNRDEGGVDCGGVCEPCKKRLAGFFSLAFSFMAKYGMYLIIIVLLAVIIILLYMLLARKAEEKEEGGAVKIAEVKKPEEAPEAISLFKPGKPERYYGFIDGLKDSIKTYDISRAADLYIKARGAYIDLPNKEKQKAYDELSELYSQTNELVKDGERKEALINQKEAIGRKEEELLSRQIELEGRIIEEKERRVRLLEEEIQKQRKLRIAEESRRREELEKQRDEEEKRRKEEELLSRQIELEGRIIEEKERRVNQLEEEILEKRRVEKRIEAQIGEQKLGAIKQAESRLRRNQEESGQLLHRLRKIDAEKRDLSRGIGEIGARQRRFADELSDNARQRNELNSKGISLFEDYRRQSKELGERLEAEKSAAQARLRKLRLDEQELEERIRRRELHVIDEKKEIEDGYRRFLQELGKKENELKHAAADLEGWNQQALIERQGSIARLRSRENDSEETRLRLEELSKEREQIAAELSELKPEPAHSAILSGVISICKEKFQKNCKKIIGGAKEAIKSNDISKADEMYIKARDAYIALPDKEKQAVYHDLMDVYLQIAQADKEAGKDELGKKPAKPDGEAESRSSGKKEKALGAGKGQKIKPGMRNKKKKNGKP